MGNRSLFLLALIFLALLVGYVLQQRAQRPSEVSEVFKPLAQGLELSEVKEIYLFQAQEGLRLRREGGDWWVEDGLRAPAEKSKIEHLLELLSRLSGELRAEGEEFFSDFGLKDQAALHVALKGRDGRDLFHLLIGHRGPQWESTFVRLAGQKRIYLVPEDLLGLFEIWDRQPKVPSAKVFVELKVIDLLPDNLDRLSLSWPRKKVYWEISRDQKGVYILRSRDGEEKAMTKEVLEKFLKRTFPVYATDVLGKEEAGGCQFNGRLEVLDDRGVVALEIGHLPGGDLCLKKEGIVYRLGPQALEGLLRP
ncbi:DUF4340 domain-containing protein [Thermosulfuriphilus sp.]